jgi:hypothetical protein
MSGAEPRAAGRGLFRKLEMSSMLFIIDNPDSFQTGLEIHGLHTRSKNQLFIQTANLTSVQKGITFSGIKKYISLPTNILNPGNYRKQFKNELYRYLINNSFYSVKKILEFSRDNYLICYFCCNLYCIILLLCYAHYLILETAGLTFFYSIVLCSFVLFVCYVFFLTSFMSDFHITEFVDL